MKMRGRYGIRNPIGFIALFSLLFNVTNSIHEVANAAECQIPSAPILSAEWRGDFPELTALNPVNGSSVTKVVWARSFYSQSLNKWGEWSPWQEMAVNSNLIVIPAPELPSKFDTVAYSAYFSNQCGNSKSKELTFPLTPRSKLVFNPTVIADHIPIRVKQIPMNMLARQSFNFEKQVTTSKQDICRYNSLEDSLELIAPGLCEIEVDVNSALLKIGLPKIRQVFTIIEEPRVLPRTTKDRPDEQQKFQIHLVYVVPSGQPDRNLDMNGQIGLWSDLSNYWLKGRITRELIFDTYEGVPDVTYMKSQYSIKELPFDDGYGKNGVTFGTLEKLYKEFRNQSQTLPGKAYFFIVQGELSKRFCGWAKGKSQLGLMIISDPCWKELTDDVGELSGLSKASDTMVHELLHTFGVNHVCSNKSDIMFSPVDCPGEQMYPVTLDSNNNQYLGSAAGGANILDLKVWKGSLGSRFHIEGNCYVGQVCELPRNYWSSGTQTLELQVKKGNAWQKVATFKSAKGSGVKNYPYTYTVSITLRTVGVFTYRYVLQANSKFSKYVGKPFTISVPY